MFICIFEMYFACENERLNAVCFSKYDGEITLEHHSAMRKLVFFSSATRLNAGHELAILYSKYAHTKVIKRYCINLIVSNITSATIALANRNFAYAD